MRKILFRGKHNGVWIEGNLIVKKGGVTIITPDDTPLGGYVRVDPTTVGQYTGLTDKNGVKIFEGDIVSGYFNYKKVQGVITYGSDAVFYIHRDGLYGIGLNNANDWLEVIGNIHDDPGLLKGDTE